MSPIMSRFFSRMRRTFENNTYKYDEIEAIFKADFILFSTIKLLDKRNENCVSHAPRFLLVDHMLVDHLIARGSENVIKRKSEGSHEGTTLS